MSNHSEMLRDSARRALLDLKSRPVSLDVAGRHAAPGEQVWALAVEMGWTGLLIPENSGGLGLSLADGVVLGEELGRGLFAAPFAPTAIVTASLASLACGQEWREDVIPGILDGRIRVSIIGLDNAGDVAGEPALRVDEAPPARLYGQCGIVSYPNFATHFLVLTSDKVARSPYKSAFLLPRDLPGIAVSMRQSLDESCPIGTVHFDGAALSEAPHVALSLQDVERLKDASRIMASADLVGTGQAALDMAVAYAAERHQFGLPIGSFQAIKHKLCDDFVAVENARSATRHAAAVYDAGAAGRGIATDVAWRCAAEAALRATTNCVQVHGALGFSWEHAAHHFLKRARRLAAAFGGAYPLRDRIGEALDQIIVGRGWELFDAVASAKAAE
jgi:alkylation response protein AidB-like acyl-CoA dehydrogenase